MGPKAGLDVIEKIKIYLITAGLLVMNPGLTSQ
jgi:hypothetical protein